MRVGKVLLVTVALLGFSVGVSAQGMHGMQNQMNNQNSPRGMMGGSGGMMGMMGGMMGNMMHGGQGMMGQFVPSVNTILLQASNLNLTDDQTQSLENQSLTLKKRIIQLNADAQIAQIDLRQALNASDLNQKNIEKALENQNSKQLDLQKAQLDSYFKGLKELTAEQQKQVSAVGNGCMMMQGMYNDGDSQNGGHMGGMMQQQKSND